MSNNEFAGKVILITGSSQGIGKSLAFNLGKKGAIIGLNGRDNNKLKAVHEDFSKQSIKSLTVPGDVNNYKDCEKIVSKLISEYGRLDVVVANASVMVEAGINEIQPDVLKIAIDSQAIGTTFPIKAALPYLIESKGYILMISSLAAFYTTPRYTTYSMGKATQTLLAQGLRFEMKGTGVDVGIAYVCFTKNENGKTMIRKDGSLSKMPPRPGKMQFSREKVSAKLAGMISKRSKSKTFSIYGKAYRFASKFCPGLIRIFFRVKLNSYTVNSNS